MLATVLRTDVAEIVTVTVTRLPTTALDTPPIDICPDAACTNPGIKLIIPYNDK